MIYLKPEQAIVWISSRYLSEEDLIRDLESQESLHDSSELEAHVSASHTSSVGIPLLDSKHGVPNLIVYKVTSLRLEESLRGVVPKSIEQITQAWICLHSDVHLSHLWDERASDSGVGSRDHKGREIVVWLNDVGSKLDHGLVDLEAISHKLNGGVWAISGVVSTPKSKRESNDGGIKFKWGFYEAAHHSIYGLNVEWLKVKEKIRKFDLNNLPRWLLG